MANTLIKLYIKLSKKMVFQNQLSADLKKYVGDLNCHCLVFFVNWLMLFCALKVTL